MFSQLLSTKSVRNRSETIRNEFPVKFRVDIGPRDSFGAFSSRKTLRNRKKNPKIPSGGADLHREVNTTPPGSRKISKK